MEQAQSRKRQQIPPASQITLTLAMLLASLGTSIANIALPAISEDLSVSFSAVRWVVIAYVAALTIAVLIAGPVGDRHGLRRPLQAGLGLYLVAALVCAVAPRLSVLVAGRAVQGIGAAFLMTLSMALMREVAEPLRLGRAMGLLGTASALGTALGPAAGGLLIPAFGWRSVFWVQVLLASVILVLCIVSLPGSHRRSDPSFSGLPGLLNGNLLFRLTVNLLVAAVMMATLVIGPFYLGGSLRLDAAQIGLVMAIGPAISIVSGVPSGWLVDRLGSGRISCLGLCLLLVGVTLFAILPGRMGVIGYIASILLLTPGYQLFQAANNTSALANIPRDRQAVISAALNLSRNLGLLAGSSLLGWLFAAVVGADDIVHASAGALSQGLRITFLAAAILLGSALTFGLVSRQFSQAG